MAETWRLLLFRPGNKARPCTPDSQTIYEYLHCGKYPAGSTKPEMSNTNESKELCYHARMVFFITYPRITNANQQRKIIQTCYADKLGGHFGRDKTLEKIASRSATSLKDELLDLLLPKIFYLLWENMYIICTVTTVCECSFHPSRWYYCSLLS